MRKIILLMICLAALQCFGAAAKKEDSTKLQALNIVTQGLNSGDVYSRVKAIEVVSNAKQHALMPIVEKMMADDFVPVRFAAAVAVGDMKYKHSKKALENLVDLGDASSRIAAAYALAKLGDYRHVGIIRKALAGDDQSLKANAAMLLGRLRNKDYLPALYNVFKEEKASDAAMLQAAEAIARIGDAKIYQRLWTLLISKHPDDRITGIQAMGLLKTPESREAILTMLHDEVLEVRLVAAAELGKIGDNAGVSDVVDALTKPLTQIDREALERAYSYRNKDNSGKNGEKEQARPIQMPIHRTQDEYEKAVERSKMLAALAIGYIKNAELEKYLPQLLVDGSVDVRIAAAQSVLIKNK